MEYSLWYRRFLILSFFGDLEPECVIPTFFWTFGPLEPGLLALVSDRAETTRQSMILQLLRATAILK